MNEKTPGQAAHDTWCAEDDWDQLDSDARDLWVATADAACDAAMVHADLQLAAERDEARALVAELRAILLQGGQNAGDVRRWAIAALDRAGMIGNGK